MNTWVSGHKEAQQPNIFSASGRPPKGGNQKKYHGGQQGRKMIPWDGDGMH